MTDDHSIKKLAERVRSGTPPRRRQGKSNRTHSLAEPNYTRFQSYCRSKGHTASEMIDQLIEIFLAEVRDDLPPDLPEEDVG